jgi:hypothetical protein
MNSQLTYVMAQSRQQDLLTAAERTRGAAGLSTGSSLIQRLRESALATWAKRPTSSHTSTDTPVTA